MLVNVIAVVASCHHHKSVNDGAVPPAKGDPAIQLTLVSATQPIIQPRDLIQWWARVAATRHRTLVLAASLAMELILCRLSLCSIKAKLSHEAMLLIISFCLSARDQHFIQASCH